MITRMVRDEGSHARHHDATPTCLLKRRWQTPARYEPPTHDQVARVSCKKMWYSPHGQPRAITSWPSTAASSYNIIRSLNNARLQRHHRAVQHAGRDDPRPSIRTALFLSNGPGDPGGRDAAVIELVRAPAGQAADFRHLPGASDDCAGLTAPRPIR